MTNSRSQPGERYWRALEPFCETVSIYDGAAVFQDQFRRLPSGIGILLSAHWLDSEVCNRGFHQFFFNSTGVLGPEANAAFRSLDLADAAAVVQEALSLFGQTYPRERADRTLMLESIHRETLSALDSRYYELLSSDRFACAADDYAEHNIA